MSIADRLTELGLELPPLPNPAGNYVHWVRTGNLLYLSGKGPAAGPSARWGRTCRSRSRTDMRETWGWCSSR